MKKQESKSSFNPDKEIPIISINEIPLNPKHFSPFDVVKALLLIVKFEYSPIRTLRSSLLSVMEIAQEYLMARKVVENDKVKKKECISAVRSIKAWRERIGMDREWHIKNYYDFLMRCEGLGTLPGFGVCQTGEVLVHFNINPEKQTLRSIPKDL